MQYENEASIFFMNLNQIFKSLLLHQILKN